MRKYRVWQAPVWSLFSTEFYRYVAVNWRVTGLLYLFVLLIVQGLMYAALSISNTFVYADSNQQIQLLYRQ